MSLGTAGNKSRFAREVDVNNPEDGLNLTAAAAAKLDVIHAIATTDLDGTKHIVVDAVANVTKAGLTLTDYASFDIGSRILTTDKYEIVKDANSATAVIGDWSYVAQRTQVS